jgi:hypothetical protein
MAYGVVTQSQPSQSSGNKPKLSAGSGVVSTDSKGALKWGGAKPKMTPGDSLTFTYLKEVPPTSDYEATYERDVIHSIRLCPAL